ncbi:MAG: thiamine phosphate synthase [Synergistaceae bacterium]|jgi:thiamine-phosphate pyrophosphorylase|nr:thiamine phosphate synthase [Synergistaceae bacterium]
MKREIDYSLYLVTDRDLMSAPDLETAVERAVKGGCTLVQLREKTAGSREFFETAVRVKAVTDSYGVPLIINDRLDIALAADADGVHIGQDDLPADVARRLIGSGKILGVSASSLGEAEEAVCAGADYLGIGAMFATGTKTDADLATMDELRRIRRALSIPIVVIGGINQATAPSFRDIGIDGLAVVSAIIGAPDIEAASREMREVWDGFKR